MMLALLLASLMVNSETPSAALASWYGAAFHGELTSCGEVFDMYATNTFAHKELPPGTLVEFSYGDRSRVGVSNDDGPYCGDREFDLSYGLFCELTDGRSDLGVVRVRWEIVGYKPRDTMRYNLRGAGEYSELFAREARKFAAEARGA